MENFVFKTYEELYATIAPKEVIQKARAAYDLALANEPPHPMKAHKLRFEKFLHREGVPEKSIMQVFAEDINHIFIETIEIHSSAHTLIKEIGVKNLKTHTVIPFNETETSVDIAVASPYHRLSMAAIKLKRHGKRINIFIACEATIVDAINDFFSKEGELVETMQEEHSSNETVVDLLEALDAESTDENKISQAVNSIIVSAVNQGASDIHIEPSKKKVAVRFRVDGILRDIHSISKKVELNLISRIKIMASLNIAEKRLPQDGKIERAIGDKILDMRVSTLPGEDGESVVIRLLDRSKVMFNLDVMGFEESHLKVWRKMIRHPDGIILVTGPTGSGKTTTLYGSLSEINDVTKKIITVEDPVEYTLSGINQIAVSEKAGVTFENTLRAMLRQDPDIVLVGEIRDAETAKIAVQASQTGHLVFSTLHTNNSAGALNRLVEMGVEPFLVSSSIRCILSQRLVRCICTHCKEEISLDEKTRAHLVNGVNIGKTIFRGKGCPECHNTGYRGRKAIFELLPIIGEIKDLINASAPSHVIQNKAIKYGMSSLRMSGMNLAATGVTTIEEVLRVTQDDTDAQNMFV